MHRSRFPMERQPSIPVRDLAARHIVTDARTAGSEQRGSEASRLLLVPSGTRACDARLSGAKEKPPPDPMDVCIGSEGSVSAPRAPEGLSSSSARRDFIVKSSNTSFDPTSLSCSHYGRELQVVLWCIPSRTRARPPEGCRGKLDIPAPPSANDCRLRPRDGVSRRVQWATESRSNRGRFGQGARGDRCHARARVAERIRPPGYRVLIAGGAQRPRFFGLLTIRASL